MTDLTPTDMLRPPINRAMRVLDRSYFKKTVPLAAARVLERKQIARCRQELEQDLLKLERVSSVKDDQVDRNLKALLLRPEIKHDNASTWSEKLQRLVTQKQIAITKYDLDLTYDYWDYHDIMSAILPEDEMDEIPVGFSIVGHVAHLNLREPYLPHKHLLGEVLLDKNPTVKTVINKIDDVGAENPYRTFAYELLAGSPDLNVEVSEGNCVFRFDYSKVYWNSRLNTEHKRLVEMFKEGEAVCDVMAGVGPFAVPAGKKRIFVWANDLNPDSYEGLEWAVKRNKVTSFVRPFREDGHTFIQKATQDLLNTDHQAIIPPPKLSRNAPPNKPTPSPIIIPQPRTFAHYIMNLPASALLFLPNFIGLYRGKQSFFEPSTETKLPMVHVYCFGKKADDNRGEEERICLEISKLLQLRKGAELEVGDGEKEGEVSVWDVRDVAPQKRMFCASFRLPGEVAFRS